VEDLLRANRISVLAVAHALETHKTVTGDDIEAIIEGRPGPLIDGRVYADPEFARVVEEYHAQAISAHKGHGDFEIALPTLNGQRREGTFDSVGVRPDGSYAGPSPWSRPAGVGPTVVPPPVPPPPVWPEPAEPAVENGVGESGAGETGLVDPGEVENGLGENRAGGGHGAAEPGGAVENGAVENGAVENGAVENGAIENVAIEHGAVEHGVVENGAVGGHGAVGGGAVDDATVEESIDPTVAGSEAPGRPADD
jgi:hypothetical protein